MTPNHDAQDTLRAQRTTGWGYRGPPVILVFGTVCLDRLRRVPYLPPLGGYVEIESESVLLGGEAANTANALTRWGAEVTLCGNGTGEGIEAELLSSFLVERALELSPAGISEKSHMTPVCDIYVTPDGERTMIGRGFSQMEPRYDGSLLPFAAGEWFTAEPNMSGLSRQVAAAAHAAGMKLYLMDFIQDDEPIPAGAFWQSSTDWLGHRNDPEANVEWVDAWAKRYGCFTILSDGPNGFVAGSPDLPARVYPPFPSPTIVDTTGAGDLFRAGMLFGLSQDWPLARCLAFASAAGCLKCRSLGATSDVPTVDEIEGYIAANPDVARAYGLAV